MTPVVPTPKLCIILRHHVSRTHGGEPGIGVSRVKHGVGRGQAAGPSHSAVWGVHAGDDEGDLGHQVGGVHLGRRAALDAL